MKQEKIVGILNSSKDKKYKYFLSKVVDQAYLWGLYKDGWAMASDEVGNKILPLWPENEFAQICVEKEWIDYIPEKIDIYEFIEKYIDELFHNDIQISIFYTPEDIGIVCNHEFLKKDLKLELSRIE
ncbi:MAG: hypothetical protein HEEMFOPI_01672 [Holosporales bacterium]